MHVTLLNCYLHEFRAPQQLLRQIQQVQWQQRYVFLYGSIYNDVYHSILPHILYWMNVSLKSPDYNCMWWWDLLALIYIYNLWGFLDWGALHWTPKLQSWRRLALLQWWVWYLDLPSLFLDTTSLIHYYLCIDLSDALSMIGLVCQGHPPRCQEPTSSTSSTGTTTVSISSILIKWSFAHV